MRCEKGEHGALLFSKDGDYCAAYPCANCWNRPAREIPDAGTFWVSGAGRTRVRTALRKALVHASAVASFGVEGFSLERFQKLSTPDIQVRVDELKSMVKV